MTYTLDRFEDDYAILENRLTGQMQEIPKEIIPKEAKEGDILKLIAGKYVIDIETTNQQKEYIKLLMDKLKNK